MKHPRDLYISIYGKKPVLEALQDKALPVARVLMARGRRDAVCAQIRQLCAKRGVPVTDASMAEVSRISKAPSQDQGVVCDIETPLRDTVAGFLEARGVDASLRLLVLDGVTTPANVGMIIRASAGLGLDGIVLPRFGCPPLNALVIKASAGTVFRAPLLSCETPQEALALLRAEGVTCLGMDAGGADIRQMEPWPARVAVVLGNETAGLSEPVRAQIDTWCAIPMQGGVDSLNVATAAAIAGWEMTRAR